MISIVLSKLIFRHCIIPGTGNLEFHNVSSERFGNCLNYLDEISPNVIENKRTY